MFLLIEKLNKDKYEIDMVVIYSSKNYECIQISNNPHSILILHLFHERSQKPMEQKSRFS